ncbi:MAG: TIGR02147 family protein [Bdellovibrionales bacterium]|nr:TIGR02147 family protein [Bdellovibrionales bacterium]
MAIFNFTNYKQFVREKVSLMPHRGRGQFRQMALHLGVNSTAISQIFKGSRHLTPEQGLRIAQFLGLSDLETRYFVNMIHKDRAGTHDLRDFYLKEEKKLLAEGKNIKSRIIEHNEISDENKAIFYSNWYYSGLRMLSALPTHNTPEEMADYFGLNRALVNKVITFLVDNGLCVEKDGKISVGPRTTYLDSNSPLINNHRRNWRLKALEKIQQPHDDDLFYSSPMSMSEKDKEALREELVALIAKFLKRIQKSPEEKLVCFNIDWFSF